MAERLEHPVDRLRPGQRVVVTQQIPQRDQVWSSSIAGTVIRYEQRKTGSWYAHAKDGRLWLDRLEIETDDGERVDCSLDSYTHIEVIEPPTAEAEPAPQEAEPEAAGPDDEAPAQEPDQPVEG